MNVRTLNAFDFDFDYVVPYVASYMKRHRIHLLCLTETHCVGPIDKMYQTEHGTYKVVASGLENTHRQGVAFVIAEDMAEMLISVKHCDKEPGRIISAQFDTGKSKPLRITGIYAPAFTNHDDDLSNYSEFLSLLVDYISDHGVVLGDPNPSMGPSSGDSGEVIGGFSYGKETIRGTILLQWCIRNGFHATNTFFERPVDHRWSWLSPDTKTRTLIDYVLVSQSLFGQVIDAGVLRDNFIATDHRLIFCALRNLFTAPQNRRFVPPSIPLNLRALHDSKIADAYKHKCNSLCADINTEGKDMNTIFEELKCAVKLAADSTIPKKDRRPSALFISDGTKCLIKERSDVMNGGISTSCDR